MFKSKILLSLVCVASVAFAEGDVDNHPACTGKTIEPSIRGIYDIESDGQDYLLEEQLGEDFYRTLTTWGSSKIEGERMSSWTCEKRGYLIHVIDFSSLQGEPAYFSTLIELTDVGYTRMGFLNSDFTDEDAEKLKNNKSSHFERVKKSLN